MHPEFLKGLASNAVFDGIQTRKDQLHMLPLITQPSTGQNPFFMVVVGWKDVNGKTVKAFVRLQLQSGMVTNENAYCESGERRWVNPTQRRGNNEASEPDYVDLIDFVSPELRALY